MQCFNIWQSILGVVMSVWASCAMASPATDWLETQFNADGSFQNSTDIATPLQSTSEVLRTFNLSNDPITVDTTTSVQFINNDAETNTETLTRKIIANLDANNDVSALITQLLQHQNPDGGFAEFAGYNSTILDTALAAEALALAGRASTREAGLAVGYLQNTQENDGSWGLYENNASVYVTALATQAVFQYRRLFLLDTILSSARNYLVDQRDTGALWGETFETAQALIAILPTLTDRSAVEDSVSALRLSQLPDGSFNSDVYQTAVAERALSLEQQSSPDSISLSGRVLDGDTGAPLINVEATLTGPDTLNQSTDNNGEFRFTNLVAGSYQLSLSLSGFGSLSANTILQVGDQRDLGDLSLLAATSTTGRILGTVTSAVDGTPLSGVQIIVSGVSQMALTNDNGQYQLNDVPLGFITIQALRSDLATATGSATLDVGQTLVFSPALSDLADAQVILQGIATDRETGDPLAGTLITIQGSGNDRSITTEANGQYFIDGLQPGNLILNASLAGYQTVAASVNASAKARIDFSPSLILDGNTADPQANSGLVGTLVDRITGLPLSGVTVELTLGSDNRSVLTDTTGTFSITNLFAGSAELTFSLTSYQSRSAALELPENINLDIGEIGLLPEGIQETALVQGIVVDSRTNEPLPNVTINGEFASGNITITTNATGEFELANIVDTEGQLIFQLEGYNSVNFGLNLTLGETLSLGQIRMRSEDIVELLPDLTVDSISNRSVNTDLQTQDISGSLTVSILNLGNADINSSVQLLAFYDEDQNNLYEAGVDTELGQLTSADVIKVDQTATLGIPLQGTLPFRDAPIHVWVDSDQALIESNEDNNILSTADQCEPGQCPVGTADSREFEPVLKWHWNTQDVLTIPLVGPLVDTNGDGVINDQDDPVVVFASHGGSVDGSNGTLRAINGRTSEQIWAVTDASLRTEGSTHPAIGDLDNDGIPEVVMYLRNGGVAALRNDGSLLWRTSVPTRPSGCCHYGAINIADLEGDGQPEILARSHVLNNDGSVRWSVPNPAQTVSGLAVDLDLDGNLEVVIANRAYRSDGTLYWQGPGNTILHTGFGNFDDDAFPEVIAVGSSRVNLIDQDGSGIWSVAIPSNRRFGGPPTVADMDGDGVSEIGVAGSNVYVVYNEDGSILWTQPVRDFSSSNTGSTVFDFDGDGRAEVVYADETTLRVYDGLSGDVVFSIPNSSATATEYPVVADIDGDSHAELLVVSDSGGTRGIRAFEDINDAWVNTRRIWNQYHYHIDNVNEDGTIPASPARSWQTHNTFRLNTFPECTLNASVFDPVVKWHWSGSNIEPAFNQVMSTPVVAQLNDDNGDGLIDINDTPDIIFGSFAGGGYNNPSVIRAVSGADGSDIWSVGPAGSGFYGPAVGDIDGDGLVEIITAGGRFSSQALYAYENDGTLKWQVSTAKFGQPALADLDGDGQVEIIQDGAVFDADGNMLWEGVRDPTSVAVDLDLDGTLEIIASGNAYNHDGTLRWSSGVGSNSFGSFTAIGNFDEDGFPEIVTKADANSVIVLEHTGEVKWGPIALPGGGGGPITVADMDADGEPEIGVAGALNYVVFETDGSIKWANTTQDLSSAQTGSSVFDFEGDGRAEILYSDEQFFRVYSGETGEVLLEVPNPSGTLFEYPLVVDVDNDNHAEIVVVANNYAFSGVTGIRVFENRQDNWAATRSIWNQHTYHINNINEDGTIPTQEEPSWLFHNTYRLNTFPGRNVRALPDLTASQLEAMDNGSGQPFGLSVRIGNGGGARSLSAIPVRFYQGNPATGVLIGEEFLPIIEPGQSIHVTVDNITGLNDGDPIYVVVDPDNEMDECREDNNQMNITVGGTLGQIQLGTDQVAYLPNTEVQLSNFVSNIGNFPNEYRIDTIITDTNGNTVIQFAVAATGVIFSGDNATTSETWNTGLTLAGTYTATALLTDLSGDIIDQDSTSFDITETLNGEPLASVRTTTDKPVYHTTDQVNIQDVVQNLSEATLLSATVLELKVQSPSDILALDTTITVGDLAANGIRDFLNILNLADAEQGNYTVTGRLLNSSGVALAADQAQFTVSESLNLSVLGSVTAQASVIQSGETQICTYNINNLGTESLNAVPTRYLLVNIDSQVEVSSEGVDIDLSSGETVNRVSDLPTTELAAGPYACILEATLNGSPQVLATAQFEVLESDITANGQLSLISAPRLLVLVDSAEHQENPNMLAQRNYLEALLQSLNITYRIVDHYDDYLSAVYSGLFTQTLLLSQAIELSVMDTLVLREGLNRSNSLIVANGETALINARLSQVLGISAGEPLLATGLKAFNSDIHNTEALSFPDTQNIALIIPNTAKVITTFSGVTRPGECAHPCPDISQVPGLTQEIEGQGQALYLGIDWLNQATTEALNNGTDLTELMGNLLINSHQAVMNTRPGAVVALRPSLTIEGSSPNLRAVLTFPEGSLVVDASQGESLNANQWQVFLADLSGTIVLNPLWFRPRYTNGQADVVLQVLAGDQVVHTETLSLQAQAQEQLADVISVLANLSLSDPAMGTILSFANSAQQAIDSGDPTTAVQHLLEVAGQLKQSNHSQAPELRTQTSWILWQVAQTINDNN